jgi:hypothetical protein
MIVAVPTLCDRKTFHNEYYANPDVWSDGLISVRHAVFCDGFGFANQTFSIVKSPTR